jgi:hypothetical protein
MFTAHDAYTHTEVKLYIFTLHSVYKISEIQKDT